MKLPEISRPLLGLMGLYSRLAVMLTVALLPILGLVISASLRDQDKSLSLAGRNLQTLAQLSALETERQVEGARQLLGGVSSGPSLKGSGLNQLCTEFLTNILATHPGYANVGFLDAEGKILCDALPGDPVGNFADRAYFQLALATRSFAIGEHQVGRISGRSTINFGMPVLDNSGAVKGVAFAALELAQLDLPTATASNISVTVTDRKGIVLATDTAQGSRIGSLYPDAALYTAMKALPAGVMQARDASGVDMLYSVTALSGGSLPSLFVIASVTKKSVTGPARLELLQLLLLIAVCATSGMAAARWIGNKALVEPTRRLLSDINQLAGSNAVHAEAPGKNADEIGALASAFHRLDDILKSRQAERDRHEAELQEAQDRLLVAQRIGKIGNWEFDMATRRLWWSEQVYSILEQSQESFSAKLKTLAEVIFPEDRERCELARLNFFANNVALDIEHRIITGTGRVRWVHELGEMRVDGQGRTVLSGTVQDITDRVRNERLLAAEARALKALSLGLPLVAVLEETLLGLQSILPGSIACVNLLNPDGTRLQAGAAPNLPADYIQALDGLPIGPAAGSCGTAAYRRALVVVADIESDPLWADHRALALQHDLRACWSLPVVDPSGKVLATFAVYYRQPTAPYPEDLALVHRAANVVGIAIARDMKDAALRVSEQRFRNTFAGAATGMCITTVEGLYVEVNAAYCQMLGYTAQELYGMDFNALVHADHRGKYREPFLELQTGKRDSYVAERQFLAKNSRMAWIRTSVSALRDTSGQVTGIFGIAEDITLQRQAEQALLQSQRLLSMASKITRQGAWQVELPSNRQTWSEEVYAIHELPPSLTPSATEGINYYAPEYQDTMRAHFEACVSIGTPFDLELQIITGTGRRLWVRSLGEAVKDTSGAIVSVQGAFQDIDAQKQTELRERTLASQLATTLERISDAFILIDHDWNFVFVNDQAQSQLKRSRAELLGQNVWHAFPEAVGTVFEQQYLHAVQSKTTARFEAYFEPLDTWFNVNAYPSEYGLAVYFQDITSMRRAAENLRLLETAVAHLNDSVIITKVAAVDALALNIVFVNAAFERQTGYQPHEVVGKSPYFLEDTSTESQELNRIRTALENGEPVRAELIDHTKAGAAYWVEFEMVPIHDAQGQLTHFVAIERDITERKRAEQKILQLNAELEGRVQRRTAQLEAANKELESFSYSVSHDLRSPLNTISGFCQLLLKSNERHLDTKGLHYLSRIRAGALQMGKMIDGLLSLAKLSRESLTLEAVDLSLIVRQIEHACRMREPGREVQVVVQEGLVVQADALLLDVVMQNLFENAWKYSAKQEAARIDIASEVQPDGQTAYVVQDNGAGFDMAYADKLFGMFERLHSSTDFEGTGLGLANVRRIIERHGGRIWAQGVPNKGASFYFTLSGNLSSLSNLSDTALARPEKP